MANIEMKIDSIMVSQRNNQPVVILKEKKGRRYLGIWMNPPDAEAIAVKMHHKRLPIPRPPDLFCAAISAVGARVEWVGIVALKEDTFYGQVVLRGGKKGEQKYLDSRPSDALAIGVREKVPIFVEEEVLEKAAVLGYEEIREPSGSSSEPMLEKRAVSEHVDVLSGAVQDVLAESEAEAERLNYSYVCTGHVLMALSRRMNMATKVMERAGVRVGRIQLDMQAWMKREEAIEGGGVGLTSAVKEMIVVSISEARRLGSEKVLPEHLLLGLVRGGDSVAEAYLRSLGVSPEVVYVELIRFLRPYMLLLA